MTPDLVQSREAVKRAGRATRLLLAISVALLATLGGIFAILMERQSALQEGGPEQALFAAYRIDRDARSLRQALADDARAASQGDGAARAFLALLENIDAMEAGGGGLLREDAQAIARTLAGIRSQAEDLALAFAPSDDPGFRRESLGRAALAAGALTAETEALVGFTNERIASAQARAQDSVNQLQGLTVLVVAVLAAATCLLLLNLLQQVRTVRNAAAVLENTAEAMGQAYAAAEAGNQAKSQFMATIGHEIRTPLNAILGMAELLSHAPLGIDERRHVEVIISSGTALLEMLNEILDFARIEHGRMTTETVDFDVRHLAADAARIVRGRAREKSNRVTMRFDGLAENSWYRGDPALLRRVLLNLLSNAVKFTENGVVAVRVSEAHGGAFLRFDVADTGIGIPEEARQRLFSAFSQVDSSISRRFGGTGLGLVICKRIVEMLGGSIGFESAPGKGSRFWFEVPAERTAAPADAPSQPPPGGAGPLPVLRILVVEDHPVNRQVAQQFLRMLNQDVSLACNGAEGVAMAAAERFDLILMDMQMPVMDGIAATRAIRESGSTVTIVAMTANASDDDRAACIEAGMDGFEAKPITIKRLRALVAATGVGASRQPAPAAAPAARRAEPWDAQRLEELFAAVGEDGLRDLLRLFLADVPALLSQLARAVDADDADGVDQALHTIKGAAANLGLASLAALSESLRRAEIDHTVTERLAAEIARIGALPDIKKAA